MLRALVLALDDDSRGQVGESDRGVGLVDVLAAGARSAIGIHSQVAGVDLDFSRFLGFREDRHGAGRGVNPPLRLRFRDPLHAMSAGFEPQVGKDPLAG